MDVFRFRAFACARLVLVASAVVRTAVADDDYLDLSLDELTNATVSTASKLARKTINAPDSVSIITNAEMRRCDCETLGELPGSVLGPHATYDWNCERLRPTPRGLARAS